MDEVNKTNAEFVPVQIKNAEIPVYVSVSCCLLLSVIYVSSLYVWNSKHNRDHPVTVKQRFCSVFVVMLIAPIFVYKCSSAELLEKVSLTELLGLKLEGLFEATTVPLCLTVLLFLGPICVQMDKETLRMFFDLHFWKSSLQNLIWLRNHIVAPLSEEFVFRACMMPLILQSFSPVTAVLITPLFFGTGHLHHIIERVRLGMDLKSAVMIGCFQFTYTTIFGIYSAYLFARTGHFVAPFLVHALANHMGLPDLQELWQNDIPKRIFFIVCYIGGFVGWLMLLQIATEPSLYKNNLFWSSLG